jgi:transposase
MARRHEVFIDDEQWERIEPFIPKRKRSPRGGRPPADDRACLEGILWVLRSGARWRDLPERYPSPSTCWRRLVEWEGEGVLVEIWQAFLDSLDERGLLDWDEVFVDASFSSAKKGAKESAKPSVEKVQSGWWWLMVKEFHLHAGPRVLRLLRSRSSRS